ncbi:MAG: hypothetical protein JOY68_01295 [Candidatus Dormibacteraeota bacterium]|nr:hypothetical protein [Candidatus Dormibacteraeota bacterium]
MFGRKSRTAVLERELSDAGAKAAETIGEIAEHALAAAREAGHAATPALQHSAAGLSKALEKAAESLADAGERLARSGEGRAAEAAVVARERIANASEKLAETIRPKPKKRHRLRNLVIAAAVVGGVIALVQSPLRNKISERLFGPPPEEEPESIELPGTESSVPETPSSAEQFGEPAQATSQTEGNGVASAPSGIETGQG